MSCVHYKFSSKLDYNTVTFDGLHITLSELKRQIMARERLKATDCDLQITNAQTREEYTDDEAHIPKHSSVIVRRTPIGGVKPAGRTFIVDRSDTAVVGSSRPTDSSPSLSLAQLSKTANLADANASEEDKIRAMISQSNHDYDPIHWLIFNVLVSLVTPRRQLDLLLLTIPASAVERLATTYGNAPCKWIKVWRVLSL
ncbi:E3 ubiquitin-protein ligase RBBP6-like isoform X1 [Centroberyx affinis]|uniref:E3 ubiquitin-protein ligase RBBP6-like isoform X1 n=1 Tax=Centroberyx affinis TaxID=166261 RepID=UPI003A5B9DE8